MLLLLVAAFIQQLRTSDCTSIEGVVVPPLNASPDWVIHTRIRVDGQKYIGFVKTDGSFIVSDVPSGSYLLEITNPVYLFQPVRVDINSKGKIRARKANVLQTNAVKSVPYPLRITSVGKALFFQPREQLRTLDLLLNPTVLLMVLPLLLIMLSPKMMDMNDPEFKEMQQMNILNKQNNMPELSDILSNFMKGGENSERTGGSGARKHDKHGSTSSASTTTAGSSLSEDQHTPMQRKGGRKRN
uniref:ER membrane protein complex subunit 7 n=1 Tax=Schistocephalus solidus TaxID=70667 RepID=A0A0X3NZ04_SCHSO